MNKAFISGIVASTPVLKKETGTMPHLVFSLGTRHKTRAGKFKYEKYTINAWNHVALCGASNLEQGQPITVLGYLTQRVVKTDDLTLIMTEITAEEFTLNAPILKTNVNSKEVVIVEEQMVECGIEEPDEEIIKEISSSNESD